MPTSFSPIHLAIIGCITIGIIIPLQQFKSRCNSVESQLLSDKSKHKENISSLHEQCQQQLDEHLTAKQESFQRQIDRLKEQYQTKLEEEHQKILNDAGEIYKFRITNDMIKRKAVEMGDKLKKHQIMSDKMELDHEERLKQKDEEHQKAIKHHQNKIEKLERRVAELESRK